MRTIFKSLLNGVLCALALSLMFSLTGANFFEALATPYVICAGLAAALGCYIGYRRKEKKDMG